MNGTGLTLIDSAGNVVAGVTSDGTQVCGNISAAGTYRIAILVPA